MFIIKVTEHRKELGSRPIFMTYARTFTIDGNTLTYSPGPYPSSETLILKEANRVYIMDLKGDTLDEYIVDTRDNN